MDLPVKSFNYLKILGKAGRFDRIVFQSVLPPAPVLSLMKRVNRRFVFDYDDALYVRHEEQTQRMLKAAWKVFAGSHALLDYSLKYNPQALLLPSMVDLNRYTEQPMQRVNSPLRIGWLGSVSTQKQLDLLLKPLQILAAKGFPFEFLIFGGTLTETWKAAAEKFPVRCVPSYTDEDIPGLVSGLDIGVMPLYDTEAERGKCALKLLIYMSASIPTVSSPVGEALYIIEDGVNGLLAADEAGWIRALTQLFTSPERRTELGRTGRGIVEKRYFLENGFMIMQQELFGNNAGTLSK